jgi:hypothetical protein
MPEAIDAARKLIEARLDDVKEESASLERALASLGEGDAPRRRRPGRPRKSPVAATAAPSKRRPARKRKSPKRASNKSVKRTSNDGAPARKPARPKAKAKSTKRARPQAKSTKRAKPKRAKRTPRGKRRAPKA